MNINKIKHVHIIGIGGCASSAVAEMLADDHITVSGSEMKERDDYKYLEKKGIKIAYHHDKQNLYLYKTKPDIVLFSPAVMNLNPDNPEILEARSQNIPLSSWQDFIGDFLSHTGKTGITVSGSEGKGTTAGILTKILKDTKFDPVSILGVKLKKITGNADSNIYIGKGSAYILEADEYNRNFHNYHPSINIMVSFRHDHPETYRTFGEYRQGFYKFFSGMNDPKILVLKADKNILDLVNQYKLNITHNIVWFGKEQDFQELKYITGAYIIKNHEINSHGNTFSLQHADKSTDYNVPAHPGYLAYAATGAIIAAYKLGLSPELIKKNLLTFTGLERRFDVYRTANNGVFITDYGHSPEAINHITEEIRSIFPEKKLHMIFQPHLFSRTYNFFDDFVGSLKKSDRISLVDIYPARENPDTWKNKISSEMLFDALKKIHSDVIYAGKSEDIYSSLSYRIDENDVTCFMGAGDMNLYYNKLLDKFGAIN